MSKCEHVILYVEDIQSWVKRVEPCLYCEIDRLRAEVERLTQKKAKDDAEYVEILFNKDGKYEVLKARADRLEAALRDFVALAEANGFAESCTGRQVLLRTAQKALED